MKSPSARLVVGAGTPAICFESDKALVRRCRQHDQNALKRATPASR